jgi:hypothetical protein
MAELPLDHYEWHALAGHLDGVRVSELVGREPTPYSGGLGCPA